MTAEATRRVFETPFSKLGVTLAVRLMHRSRLPFAVTEGLALAAGATKAEISPASRRSRP
jgi:hypothetical protein